MLRPVVGGSDAIEFAMTYEVIAKPLGTRAARPQIFERCGQDARVPRQNPWERGRPARKSLKNVGIMPEYTAKPEVLQLPLKGLNKHKQTTKE